jgi:NhaP-type Na+/H+ or K+/H+ antiporter
VYGISTARRNAIYFVYTVVLESPPNYNEGGFDIWAGPRGVVTEVSRML